MALNFNLLNADLPGQIATSAMRGYEGAQDRANVLAERQQLNQLNALKMREAIRGETSQNALAKAYKESVDPTGAIDYNKLTGLVAAGGGGKEIPAIQKARSEQLTAQSTQRKAQTELIDARLKQARGFLDTIDPSDPNAPALYMKWHEANHLDPVLGPELKSRGVTAEQSRAQIEAAIVQGPAAFADLINKSKLGTEKFMEMNKMTPEIQTMTALGYPITQEGFEAYRAAQRQEQLTFQQRKELARESRSINPPAVQPPVAVVGPNGKPMFVSREQAIREGMTPAAAKTEEGASLLTRKEMQKREAALPKATQSVSIVGNTMSVIGETVDRLINNEVGLNSITGLVYGSEYAPAVTDAARQAKADLEQLKNLAFVQGLTELREASKTGAGVGNVSNKEGERFENLKASLNRKQSATSLKEALMRLKAQAQFTKQTLEETFDQTYEYRNAPPTSPNDKLNNAKPSSGKEDPLGIR